MNAGIIDVKDTKNAIISILSWDTPEYIDNLLNSLKEHQPSIKSYHIIILDQGSDSKTLEVLRKHNHKQLEIIYNSENIGFSKGHNKIYQYACKKYDFKYFCCVNSDIKIGQDLWLDQLIMPFEKDNNTGITGPAALNLDWSGVGYEVGDSELRDGKFDTISGCMFLTSKTNIEKLGLFDEIYSPAYFEDTDLNMRYKSKGLKLVYIPLAFKHDYLDAVKKTTTEKSIELKEEFGNFHYKNAKIFINRWVKKGLIRSGIKNRCVGYYKYVLFNMNDLYKRFIITLKRSTKRVLPI